MNIAYFPKYVAQNGTEILNAFLTSCRQQGIATVENSQDADMAVIWSVLWNGRMKGNEEIYHHYRSQNKPVVIIDVGTLNRGVTWKVAVNHINRSGYYGHHADLDQDRPAKLGIHLQTPKHATPEIVIAAQHSRSLQVSDINVETWISNQVAQLRQHTDRPIVVRPHPRSAIKLLGLPGVSMQIPEHVVGTYDSFDLVLNCHAIVNYNSGPGIQAAIAGVRPIVDQSSLASPVSISIADIEKPYEVDRTQWLVELSHTEYTQEEIQQGLCLKRLWDKLN
jgi:hypothetical protein